jgi:sulfate transport system substrate-binding protein
LIRPSISIVAETPVAWVDKVVQKHGTADVAKAYLEFLYSPEGQEIGARNFYRPRSEAIARKYAVQFPKMALFTVDEVFGGWQKAQKTHFDNDGTFDQIQSDNR